MSARTRRRWFALFGGLCVLAVVLWLLIPGFRSQPADDLAAEVNDLDSEPSANSSDLTASRESAIPAEEALPELIDAVGLVPGRALIRSRAGVPIPDARVLIKSGGLLLSGPDGMIELPRADGWLGSVLVFAEGFDLELSWIGSDGQVIVLDPCEDLRLQVMSKRDGTPIAGVLVEAEFEDGWDLVPEWEEFWRGVSISLATTTDGAGFAHLPGIPPYTLRTRLRISMQGNMLGRLGSLAEFAPEIESLGYFRLFLDPHLEPWQVVFHDERGAPLANHSIVVTGEGISRRLQTDAEGAIEVARGVDGVNGEAMPFDSVRVARAGQPDWLCRWEERVEVSGVQRFLVGQLVPRVEARPWHPGYEVTTTAGRSGGSGSFHQELPSLHQARWQNLESSSPVVQVGVVGPRTFAVVRHHDSGFVVVKVPVGSDGSAIVECPEVGRLQLAAPALPEGHTVGWWLLAKSFASHALHNEQRVDFHGSERTLELPVGTYEVSCTYDGAVFWKEVVQLTASGASLTVPGTPRLVRGRLLGSETGPSAGRGFALEWPGDPTRVLRTVTGPDGSFSAFVTHEGRYVGGLTWPIRALGRNGPRSAVHDLSIPLDVRFLEGEPTEIVVEEGVVVLETGQPDGVEVRLQGRFHDAKPHDWGFIINVESGDQLALPTGTYELLFHANSKSVVKRVVEVEAGAINRLAVVLPAVHRLDAIIRAAPGWACDIEVVVSPLQAPTEVAWRRSHKTLGNAGDALRHIESWLPAESYSIKVTGNAKLAGATESTPIDRTLEVQLDRDRVLSIFWSDAMPTPGLVYELLR